MNTHIKVIIGALATVLIGTMGFIGYHIWLSQPSDLPDITLTESEEIAINYAKALQSHDFESVQQLVGINAGNVPASLQEQWFNALGVDWLQNVDIDLAVEEYKTHSKVPEYPLTIESTRDLDAETIVLYFTYEQDDNSITNKLLLQVDDGQVVPKDGFTAWPQVYSPIQGVERYGLLLDSTPRGDAPGYVIQPDIWYDVPVEYTFHDAQTEQAVEVIPATAWKTSDGIIELTLECSDTQTTKLRAAVHEQMNLVLEYVHLSHNVITEPIDPVDIEAEEKAYKRMSKEERAAYDEQKALEAEQALKEAEENLKNREARMEQILAEEILWDSELWNGVLAAADSTMDTIQQYKVNIVPNENGAIPISRQLDYDIFTVRTAITAVLKGASSGTDEARIICDFTVRLDGDQYKIMGMSYAEESNPFAKVNRFVRDW